MESQDRAVLETLYRSYVGSTCPHVAALRAHGSERRIYRLGERSTTVVGVVNADIAENAAFLSFSRHFRTAGLPVPQIFATNAASDAYLEEDLGDLTLFDLLVRERGAGGRAVPPAARAVYEKVVEILPFFQVRAGRDIDESVCYPRARFDRQSMCWDLNYFKYYFLKLAQIPFHEQAVENDFAELVDFLLTAPSDSFLYRDFQSRNIMVRDGEPWFIDYQGGRRGAVHYDIASLLVDAKADLPQEFREAMLERYMAALAKQGVRIERDEFLGYYDGFTLIRILQAMGAYGFRGFYERKAHFLQSVPYAIRNVEDLLSRWRAPVKLPALREALGRIVQSTRLRELTTTTTAMTVRIESFSYKRGLPADTSGHGGGFVFDCRSLPNPGRDAAYATMAGDDPAVVAWLEAYDEVHGFLARAREMINHVIDAYRKRRFTHLSVAFGCTGGQHRSVYCATQLAQHLHGREGVQVELSHRDVVRVATPPR
ncbi:MAG: phosphotransferase [Opitutaceae bacterium]|nr:phosphotransferase [Opitutaceae bacterium]